MPEEGYSSITVTDEVYAKLRTLAEKNSRSPAKQIEHFLKTCKET
jgi:predicted CopG family antitoxin